MKEIKLFGGEISLVDDSDFEFINQYKWYSISNGNVIYASRRIYLPNKEYKTICIHNYLIPNCYPFQIDHIDRNGLNNQKSNLRLCTRSQNAMNREKLIKTTSRFKGVSWCSRDKRWTVRLRIKGKCVNMGSFTNEIEAAECYNINSKKYYGEFACPNVVGGSK